MIPKLRFPEFQDNWETTELGQCSEIQIGKSIPSSDILESGDMLICRGINVKSGFIESNSEINRFTNSVTDQKYIVQGGDILLPMDGSKVGKNIAVADLNFHNSFLIQRVARIRVPKDLIWFYFQQLWSWNFERYVFTVNTSSGIPHISEKQISSYKVSKPSFAEAPKLCDFLAMIDKKINLLTKKKEALETYKKGLMKKIFSQELRFKRENGTDYPEWTNYKLSEVLTEHKMHSNGNEQVHSVSVHKGVVNQIEHLGRSFAANDVSNYNKVFYGDVIYTKSPTGDFPYGIIKQSYVENAIVSPLYCVTSPIDINLGFLLNWFFESKINVHNYLHPIVQKGAKNTINITNKTFLSRSLFLPSDKGERQKIKVLYSSLNKNLKTLEAEISKVKEFKKGLLQQMFV